MSSGLHKKYLVLRSDGKPIDPDNEYFCLKIAGKGDPRHIDACKKALMVYAEEIRDYLPELSKDLKDNYGELGGNDVVSYILSQVEGSTLEDIKEMDKKLDDSNDMLFGYKPSQIWKILNPEMYITTMIRDMRIRKNENRFT